MESTLARGRKGATGVGRKKEDELAPGGFEREQRRWREQLYHLGWEQGVDEFAWNKV